METQCVHFQHVYYIKGNTKGLVSLLTGILTSPQLFIILEDTFLYRELEGRVAVLMWKNGIIETVQFEITLDFILSKLV
jgi:hypothetical protein